MPRARGEGTVFKNERGTWSAQLRINGHKVTRTGKSEQAAVRLLARLRRDRDKGLDPTRVTVADFMEDWIARKSTEHGARVNTIRSYASKVRAHIVPLLGPYTLASLTPRHVEDATRKMLAAGSSARNAAHVRTVLANALHDAERWGLIERNVAALAVPPRVVSAPTASLTGEQSYALLAALEGHPHRAAYMLAVLLSLREGEALALQWSDVDLDAGTVHITRTVRRVGSEPVYEPPKTHRSMRNLPLVPVLVAELRAHRVRQLADRLAAGPMWQDEGLVFAGPTGGSVPPSALLRGLYAAELAAGLPRVTFHGLRHSAATMLAHEGVAPVVAAAILGHARIATTLEVYTHVSDADMRAALERTAASVERGS